jgi:hypothetical protein
MSIIPCFARITFTHIYRIHNKEADALANIAMDSWNNNNIANN